MKLLIATTNLHKVREIRSMLKEFPSLDFYSLRDFPNYTPPEENGASFEEIASLKATDAAKNLGLVCLADDSGLVVPALQGDPGIRSARYAGENATDKENRDKLLIQMKSLPLDKRAAYFTCALAVATAHGLKKCVSGKCEGQILDTPRGSAGFGYDSLFLKYDYGKTFAELEEEVKNRVSHRRKAVDKLIPYLHQLIH